MTRRGDVVIIEFPFVDGNRCKNRPAIVIQADVNNQRLQNTIVSMISGNLRLAGQVATQVVVDPQTPKDDLRVYTDRRSSSAKTSTPFAAKIFCKPSAGCRRI